MKKILFATIIMLAGFVTVNAENNAKRLTFSNPIIKQSVPDPTILKANAGFAPEDTKREDYQIERLHRIAIDAGLDPEIAEMYREFVVTEAKKRHQRIADAGGDPGVLDVFA